MQLDATREGEEGLADWQERRSHCGEVGRPAAAPARQIKFPRLP